MALTVGAMKSLFVLLQISIFLSNTFLIVIESPAMKRGFLF
ncbi:hypothetical protein bthur0009_55630 [Bacillus thuringiensis serovar andalousiensis BGSC 4AW1]|nr:hypothetical protein bcere0023_56780 [Bacillus cereus Rock4-2]EEM68410.1 hypothetical protein bthur0009_55630 [Bacillus thuringiensis serovar andalousiensis BGSC 4AW1]